MRLYASARAGPGSHSSAMRLVSHNKAVHHVACVSEASEHIVTRKHWQVSNQNAKTESHRLTRV